MAGRFGKYLIMKRKQLIAKQHLVEKYRVYQGVMMARRLLLALSKNLKRNLYFTLLIVQILSMFAFKVFGAYQNDHTNDGIGFWFIELLFLFLMLNVIGNMFACMATDTSIRAQFPFPMPSRSTMRRYWHFCRICSIATPPRSKHCKVCHACVLKCDHHSDFLGICIGIYNRRYFMMFIIYGLIATSMICIYSLLYVWHITFLDLFDGRIILKLLCPAFVYFFDFTNSIACVFTCQINVLSFLSFAILFYLHWPMLFNASGATNGNNGSKGWLMNMMLLFGRRYYVAWIAPFVTSEIIYQPTIGERKH